LGTNCKLHLVKPFGFEISDSKLKRAGLDYWQHIQLEIHESQDVFFNKYGNGEMVFLSSHGKHIFWDIPFKKDLFIVFGKESVGLDKELLESHADKTFKIPLYSDKIRSLNIANAVGIVAYEGLRQLEI